jgi:hypothetical protein
LEIAKALPDGGYSMGSVVKVSFYGLSSTDDRTKEYSKSCKYRSSHGDVRLSLTLDEMKNIQVIGCLVTYIYPNQKSKVKKCYWYKGSGSKSYFNLYQVKGYIYAGYHSENKDRAFAGGQSKLDQVKIYKRREANYKKALRAQYAYQDSIDSGNCESGTKAFALRCGLSEDKKYRGTYLLALARSTSSLSYVEKMIRWKADRM